MYPNNKHCHTVTASSAVVGANVNCITGDNWMSSRMARPKNGRKIVSHNVLSIYKYISCICACVGASEFIFVGGE